MWDKFGSEASLFWISFVFPEIWIYQLTIIFHQSLTASGCLLMLLFEQELFQDADVTGQRWVCSDQTQELILSILSEPSAYRHNSMTPCPRPVHTLLPNLPIMSQDQKPGSRNTFPAELNSQRQYKTRLILYTVSTVNSLICNSMHSVVFQ